MVSTPQATVHDLASRPADAGGLDNVATVIVELADESALEADALAVAAGAASVSALRRAGWVAERFTALDIGALRELIAGAAPTRLDPHGTRKGPIDPGWGLIVNASVEPEG